MLHCRAARALFVSVFGLASGIFSASGCGATEERPRTEDDARQLAPLPACLVELTSARAGAEKAGPKGPVRTEGVVKSLSEDQIWRLVYPSYDPERHALPQDAVACTGRPILRDKELTGGHSSGVVQEGDISLGGGGDRLKLAWLRSVTFDDGTVGGALALIRSYASTAEVYAVGAFRGRPKTVFTLERIGPEVVAVAQDDGCAVRKAGTDCETPVTVFLPRFGALDKVARFSQERIAYASGLEPGVRGLVEYRLSSAAQYLDGGIRVLEQVLVRDELGRELRKAELERAYTFGPDGTMLVSDDSLWSRVVARAKPTK
jgi:hypothetical protein